MVETGKGKYLLSLKGLVKKGKYEGEVCGNLILPRGKVNKDNKEFIRVIVLGAVEDDEKVEHGVLKIGSRVKFALCDDDYNEVDFEPLLGCTVNYWKKW